MAAVQAEDEAYRTITRSPLSDQIAEADQVRDNTFVGLRTMVEALGRVGTAAQKEAAPRVLQAMRDYQVNISEGYELESWRCRPWPTTARRWPSRRWSVS